MLGSKKNMGKIERAVRDFKGKCAQAGLLCDDGAVNMPQVLEHLPSLNEGWYFMPVDASALPKAHLLGLANPSEKALLLREDVYERLCNGNKEDLFTAAHELGHMVLHGELLLARQEGQSDCVSLSTRYESEADAFARLFLGYDSECATKAKEATQLLLEGVMAMLKVPRKKK